MRNTFLAPILFNHMCTFLRAKGAVIALAACTSVSPLRADYPVVSHRSLADPGALVHDGRV